MTEPCSDPPANRLKFYRKLLRSLCYAAMVVACSLFIGICGYHYLESLPWVDALLNASMILGGMGPVDQMKTFSGKIFASFYALYSGLVLIGLTGILLTPVFHRVLHTFHAGSGK